MKYKGYIPGPPMLLNQLIFTFMSNSLILQLIIIFVILGIMYVISSFNKDIVNITYRSSSST